MTVGELIAHLQALPPSLTVVVNGPEKKPGMTCLLELTSTVPVWLGEEVDWHEGGRLWCFEHERNVRGPAAYNMKALLLG